MKNVIFIATLLFSTLGFSQEYAENGLIAIPSDSENFDAPSVNLDELTAFDIIANMKVGEVVFTAPDKIDYINIYNTDNREIFSAKGSIIETKKIDISFLPSGTYFLEVVIGKNMASHKIVKK